MQASTVATMSGEPLGITFKEDAVPPTVWCSRMVIAPKKDGSPRRTVDLQQVNKATLRETHHTPTPFHHANTVPAGTKKTTLDAWNGYHSFPLTQEAKDATTFITEWGRYRYCRALMGFHASGDAYTRRFDDFTKGIPRKTRCVDDSLLWDSDIQNAFWHTLDYIKLCADNGVVFNPSKFVFGEDEVNITRNRIRPTANILSAITDFPTPTDITGVRSWFELVNQVAYAFSQSATMVPFRELLKGKSTPFYCDEHLDRAFQRSKREIVAMVQDGVRRIDPSKSTCLSTDWSKTGIGFVLRQKHCQCSAIDNTECGKDHWKLILAGSRFTKDAESRYAPIEGEALALTYGLESCKMFILGCPKFLVTVDHKPLVSIFYDRSLDNITNPRLLRLKEITDVLIHHQTYSGRA